MADRSDQAARVYPRRVREQEVTPIPSQPEAALVNREANPDQGRAPQPASDRIAQLTREEVSAAIRGLSDLTDVASDMIGPLGDRSSALTAHTLHPPGRAR